MESRAIRGMSLYYDAGEGEAADLIGAACQQAAAIIEARWGLEAPAGLRVYVLTSWPRFVLHSAPLYWWPLLTISWPWWIYRTAARWKIARGWEQNYWTRQAVGVKPPRLVAPLVASSATAGKYFELEQGPEELIRSTAGHELTHAYTAHLRLPMWLNEGLAMRTVDELFARPMVKRESLELLEDAARGGAPAGYARISARDQAAILYHYVRGYWITRYVEATRPELLRRVLAGRRGWRGVDAEVAAAYEMHRGAFWETIDQTVVEHFGPAPSRARREPAVEGVR